MSTGILQLAATGKLALQLEYRMPAKTLGDLSADMETSEDIDPSLMSGSFELIYGEY